MTAPPPVTPASPRFSVVLSSSRSPEHLIQSIGALLPQCRAAGAELIVARARPGSSPGPDPEMPIDVRIVVCDARSTVPEQRGAGLAVAGGDWVAMTEDNCIVAADWLEQMRAAARQDVAVIGGIVGNARPNRSIDWGATFSEYGFFGRHRRTAAPGSPPPVTGANVAYHRTVAPDVAAWALAGTWEVEIHQRLAARGVGFAVAPEVVVKQNLHYALGWFCRDRYEHGRDYARVRSAELTLPQRLTRVAATPLVPWLLARRIWESSGRDVPGAFIRALPWTITFLSAWCIGEAVGYLTPAPRP